MALNEKHVNLLKSLDALELWDKAESDDDSYFKLDDLLAHELQTKGRAEAGLNERGSLCLDLLKVLAAYD